MSGFAAYWQRYPVNVLDLEDGGTIGGGEESCLRCAAGLAELGHEVEAWHYGAAGVWRGVEFNTLSDPLYTRLVSEHWDAVASWTALRPLMYCQPGTKRIWVNQLNDLAAPGDFTKCDVIVSPSADHAKMVYGWGWRGKHAVVHNGLDIELYKRKRHPMDTRWFDEMPWEQREMSVGYWSSPDRGLHHLLRAWPLVKKMEPKAKLFVAYEIKRYLTIALKSRNAIFSGRAFDLQKLMNLCDDSVTFIGAVPRKKLAKYQKQCRVMCYPFDPICYTEGFCHPVGTMITTLDGLKPVEQLTLQDRVLGRSGAWRPVTALRSRRFEGNLVVVRPACGEEVELTDDHPVYAAGRDSTEFRWIPAGQLSAGMWLYSVAPRETSNQTTVAFPVRQLTPARAKSGQGGASVLGGKEPVVLPEETVTTPELCRLVGYFAGDGNAASRGRSASTVSFFLGTEQKEMFVTDLCQSITDVFGVSPRIEDKRPKKNMLAIRLESSSIAYVFSSWCYASDGRKRLPEWAMTLPTDLTGEVLKGLWRTDGSVFTSKGGSRFAAFTSSSPYLIGQVRILLARLGYVTKVNRRIHETGRSSWQLHMAVAGNFLDYGGKIVRCNSGDTHTKKLVGAVALKVREVSTLKFCDTVYALTVAEDESYHVGNFLVHNCGAVNQGVASGSLVLTTPKDALPSLYGDSVYWLKKPTSDLDFYEYVAEETVKALHGELPHQQEILKAAAENCDRYTWARAAKEMEAVCRGENWTECPS